MGDYTAANLLSSRFGTGDTTGTDFEGLPDLRPSYDSFFSADSDAQRGGRQKAVQLNGAMTALEVLQEVPLEEALHTDVRSSARRSPKVALEWEELPAGQASVRRPPSLRGQVVKTQQAVSHAIEGIIRSLEDGSITEEPAGISRDEELPQEAEVKMLRAERASLQQQLQSLTEELEAAQVKVKDTEDVSKELALINCFKEVALKHRSKLGFEGTPSRDHEVVAKHVPELLQTPKVSHLELEVDECF
mmetsp:Transcript_70032/g.154366  ORF Transcript_70032/g.154366 Transcript_70032/m.154366 type:complete len:247 (-) Transcript_70032:13-753(-)